MKLVKPLEWKGGEGNYPKWDAEGYEFKACIDKYSPRSKGHFPLHINGVWDGKKHQNLASAKAAAQAKYVRHIEECQRRILSALDTAPDHSDWNAAIEAAASLIRRVADGYEAGGDAAIATGLRLTEGNVRSLKKGSPND